MAEHDIELDPHPIRDLVARLLKDGTDEPARFDPAAQRSLIAAVDGYLAQPDREIHAVVRTLISIFEWLRHEQRSPAAARALKACFKRPEVIARIEAIEAEIRCEENNRRKAAIERRAAEFSRMAAARPRSAPLVGAGAPVGCLKLGHLHFPKKL